MIIVICQITAVVFMVALGAFFAGSETGVYRLSKFHLRLGAEQKRPFFALLARVMDDSHGLIFSMLIANNLVHYIVTSIVTVMLLKTSDAANAALYATVIMTPVLFVFSEVIPKNVYYYKADTLMRCMAPVLWFFHKLFTWSGSVAVLKMISKTFGRLLALPADTSAAFTSRGESRIKQIIRETHDEGILSSVQTDIMNRLINIPDMPIGSVMTPISATETLNVKSDSAAVNIKLRRCPYTRLPVYEDRGNNVIGFIHIYEVLRTGEDFQDLRNFVKPIARFSMTTSVIDAINKMRNQGHKIVLVVPRHSLKPVGIVTMKDLVEELTGELAEW